MSEQKIFVGSGKKSGQYDIINLNICLSEIPKEHITTSQSNGKKYLRLVVAAKKQTDQYGNTHSVAIDTWKPEPKQQQKKEAPTAPVTPSAADYTDDLPF